MLITGILSGWIYIERCKNKELKAEISECNLNLISSTEQIRACDLNIRAAKKTQEKIENINAKTKKQAQEIKTIFSEHTEKTENCKYENDKIVDYYNGIVANFNRVL